ncbi:unnamed protein product [Musa hybrid cultivar]
MGLELKLCAMRIVGGFVKEASAIGSGSGEGGRAARLEESIKNLEEEKRKIEAFKRELPLCMLLLSEVIEGLNKEIQRCRGDRFGCVFEEFIPMKSKVEEDGRVKAETDCKDKKNWMSSAQLWSDNHSDNDDDDKAHANIISEEDGGYHRNFFSECKNRNGGGAFVPFKRLSSFAASSKEQEKPPPALPDLSLQSPAIENTPGLVTCAAEDHRVGGCGSKAVDEASESSPATANTHLNVQPPRKARRCWSQELHRRFVLAIQQLGGAQVATPKQIREQMKVDGLTNDEVKSHLQKYRLHARRVHNASATADRPVVGEGLWIPQKRYAGSSRRSASRSGSPQSPLHLAGSAHELSITAGDSSEEDGKSESCSWK